MAFREGTMGDQPQVSHVFTPENESVYSGDMSCDSSAHESTYSYNSIRDINQFVREVNGRKLNNQNFTYFLPCDGIEYTRLDKQHLAMYIAAGSLCPAMDLVKDVLADDTPRIKKILDIGCGTGAWAISMARQFPDCDVVGVDLAPCPVNEIPGNCRFELDDVMHGLAHFYNQFDFVHVRFIIAGITDFAFLIDEAIKCLRPGGMLFAMEGDKYVCRPNQITIQPMATNENPDGSWLGRFFYEARDSQRLMKGGDTNAAYDIIDKGLWGYEGFDDESCVNGHVFTPLGPWPVTADWDEMQRLSIAGTLWRQNMKEWIRAAKQLFPDNVYPKQIIEQWIANIDAEISTTHLKSWIRARFMYGRKLMEDGTPTPRTPKPQSYGPPPSISNAQSLPLFPEPPYLDPNADPEPAPEIPDLNLNMPIPQATDRNLYRQIHYRTSKKEAELWYRWGKYQELVAAQIRPARTLASVYLEPRLKAREAQLAQEKAAKDAGEPWSKPSPSSEMHGSSNASVASPSTSNTQSTSFSST